MLCQEWVEGTTPWVMLLGGQQQQQQPERPLVDSDDHTDSGSITCLCVGSLLLVVGLHISHGLGKLNLQQIIIIIIIIII